MEDLLEMRDKLSKEEIYYINLYDTFNSGYNSTLGGEGALGRVLSEETKQKISKSKIGGGAVPDVQCFCSNCDKEFNIQPWIYRLRIKRSKSGRLYCSSKCKGGLV